MAVLIPTPQRPPVSQPYSQGAVNMSGPPPSSYPQHYGLPPTMQQVTIRMIGMQITSGPPTPAEPGYGPPRLPPASGALAVTAAQTYNQYAHNRRDVQNGPPLMTQAPPSAPCSTPAAAANGFSASTTWRSTAALSWQTSGRRTRSSISSPNTLSAASSTIPPRQ